MGKRRRGKQENKDRTKKRGEYIYACIQTKNKSYIHTHTHTLVRHRRPQPPSATAVKSASLLTALLGQTPRVCVCAYVCSLKIYKKRRRARGRERINERYN